MGLGCVFVWTRISHVIITIITLLQLYDVGVTEGAAEELRPENCWFTSRKAFLLAFLIPYWLILIATIYYIVRGILAIRWAAALAPTRKVCTHTFFSNHVYVLYRFHPRSIAQQRLSV